MPRFSSEGFLGFGVESGGCGRSQGGGVEVDNALAELGTDADDAATAGQADGHVALGQAQNHGDHVVERTLVRRPRNWPDQGGGPNGTCRGPE